MEIRGPGFRVWYEGASATVHFEGSLRLGTSEYEPMTDMLQKVLDTKPKALVLRMTELTFLNSSGINMLYKFAIAVRKQGGVAVTVRASNSIPWQSKSLANLKKFLPTIAIVSQ